LIPTGTFSKPYPLGGVNGFPSGRFPRWRSKKNGVKISGLIGLVYPATPLPNQLAGARNRKPSRSEIKKTGERKEKFMVF
jgi:hypothetical protein